MSDDPVGAYVEKSTDRARPSVHNTSPAVDLGLTSDDFDRWARSVSSLARSVREGLRETAERVARTVRALSLFCRVCGRVMGWPRDRAEIDPTMCRWCEARRRVWAYVGLTVFMGVLVAVAFALS